MPNLSEEDIKKIKEERKMKIREEMGKRGLFVGVVVVKTDHRSDCGCDDCLTIPEPFCPFPE